MIDYQLVDLLSYSTIGGRALPTETIVLLVSCSIENSLFPRNLAEQRCGTCVSFFRTIQSFYKYRTCTTHELINVSDAVRRLTNVTFGHLSEDSLFRFLAAMAQSDDGCGLQDKLVGNYSPQYLSTTGTIVIKNYQYYWSSYE